MKKKLPTTSAKPNPFHYGETNIFRGPNNQYLLQALFFENMTTTHPNAMYTIDPEDKTRNGKTYVSLRRLYLEEQDPTEYSFATKYLDGWDHWKKLSNSLFLKDHVTVWREELLVKLRSEALKGIIATSRAGSKESYQAQKFILDQGWDKSGKTPAKDKKVKDVTYSPFAPDSDLARMIVN